MRHTESRLQSECVRWFRLAHPALSRVFFSIPNGVATSATQGRILKAEGMVAGVADTFLAVARGGYHGLFIEFKQGSVTYVKGRPVNTKTYQRPEQKEWQRDAEAQGYRYEVVRSVDEFIRLIDGYLNDKNGIGDI